MILYRENFASNNFIKVYYTPYVNMLDALEK